MNVSAEGPITVFPNRLGDDRSASHGHIPDDECADYFRRRERIERAAAKSSNSTLVRRIHQELAQAYAAAVRKKD